ncbi:hypothetical protein BC938DRAFT_484255 [Jimgerdemannia flammicorona]|uniref:Virilizer N-terminal domain-containing protein n=1 Tax=Jimgerdemannia flammicorona TaxID=994334 RepID=A0A433QA86_9FUNG|nr:hypothetical protein BC938DRAFT_484255 [Jimgerdemannia flammicorona]
MVLVYFGTISPTVTAPDTIECIRFNQKVVLSDLRIVPKNLKPFTTVDRVGQTFPPNLNLQLLVHTSPLQPPSHSAAPASSDAPKKRPTQQYLHAVNIHFDETNGYQAFDVGGGKEVFTRFIMIRGSYKHLTLCIYGAVLDGTTPANGASHGSVPRQLGNGPTTTIGASKDVIKTPLPKQQQEKEKDDAADDKSKEHLQPPQTSPTTTAPHSSSPLPKPRDRPSASRWGGSNIAIANPEYTAKDVPPTPTSASSDAQHEPTHTDTSSPPQSRAPQARPAGDEDHRQRNLQPHSTEHTLSPNSPHVQQHHRDRSLSHPHREEEDLGMDEAAGHSGDAMGDAEMEEVVGPAGDDAAFVEPMATDEVRPRRNAGLGVVDPLDLRAWSEIVGIGETLLAYHPSPSGTLLRHASLNPPSGDSWDRLQRLAGTISGFVTRHQADASTGPDAKDKDALQHDLDDVAGCFVEGIVFAMRQVPPVNYGGEMDQIVAGVSWAMDMRLGKSSMKLLSSALALISLMCACGEDVAETVLARNLINRLVSLLHIPHATSLLRLRVLTCLLECMDDPRVVERLLGWDLPSSTAASLLQRHILTLVEDAPLPTRVAAEVKRVVRKASVYEACAVVQRLAEERVERQIGGGRTEEEEGMVELEVRRRTEMEMDEGDENLPHGRAEAEAGDVAESPEDYHNRERAALKISGEISRCLKRLQKAALADHAMVSAAAVSVTGKTANLHPISAPSILSFRHMTTRRLLPSLTVLLGSHLVRGSPRALAEVTAAVARFCATLVGTRDGMMFLAEQVWKRVGMEGEEGHGAAGELDGGAEEEEVDGRERMLSVWASLLFDEPMLEDDGGAAVILLVDELRRMPGVTDVWCGYVRGGRGGGMVAGGEYDDDYDYYCDEGDDDESDTEDDVDDDAKAVRRTLQMQTFGAVRGDECGNDALDVAVIESAQTVMMVAYQAYAVACVEALLDAKRIEVEAPLAEGSTREEIEDRILYLLGALVDACIFAVGKQAVATAVIHLDAFSTVVSFASASSSSIARYALELLDVVLKSPLSLALTLDSVVFDLVSPLVHADSALRPWLDPLAAWHARAGILGVLETLLVHNNKHYTVQETHADEFLQDLHVVPKVLLALRILIRHSYSTGTDNGGIMEVMMSLPEDMNPNGEGLLVFLFNMMRSAADVLARLVDFSTPDMEEGVGGPPGREQQHEGDQGKGMQNANPNDAQDRLTGAPTATLSTSSAGSVSALPSYISHAHSVVSVEAVELRRMLLEVVFCELLLARRIFRFVYGNTALEEDPPAPPSSPPSSSVRNRHFVDIFGNGESLDNPLPSQTGSVLKLSLNSLLALASALDRMDWRMSDQFGAYYSGGVAGMLESRAPKTGQTAVVARVRGMLFRTMGALGSIVTLNGRTGAQVHGEGARGTSEMDVDADEDGGGRHTTSLAAGPWLFSQFAGHHILKTTIEFLLEAPENFLSGLQVLQEVLPVPLPIWTEGGDEGPDVASMDKSDEHNAASGEFRRMSREGYDARSPLLRHTTLPSTTSPTAQQLRDLQQDAIPLREYWLEQVLLTRVDIVRMVRMLGASSVKSVHLALRSLVVQMVDLDHADVGFSRELIRALVIGLDDGLRELKAVFAKEEVEQRGSEDEHQPIQHRVTFKGVEERSVDIEQQMAVVARWLSLLTVLDTWPVGRLYLLETALAEEGDSFTNVVGASSSSYSLGIRLIPLLLDVMQTIKSPHCAVDLSLEIIDVLMNIRIPPATDDHALNLMDMTAIVDFLLHCIRDDERLRTLSLNTIMPLLHTSTGTLILLGNSQLPSVLGILVDWIPSSLISSTTSLSGTSSFDDPAAQHNSRYIINVVFHSLDFIRRLIEHPIFPSHEVDSRPEDESPRHDEHALNHDSLVQSIHMFIEGAGADQHERCDSYNQAVDKLKDIMYEGEQRGDVAEMTWWEMGCGLLEWVRDAIVMAEPNLDHRAGQRRREDSTAGFADVVKTKIEMRLKEVDGQRKQGGKTRSVAQLLASVSPLAHLGT